MKVNVLGVKRIQGKAKETGNPYDICTLLAVLPIQTGPAGPATISGYGYEIGEMTLDPEALPQFSNHKFPAMLELTIEPVLYRGKIEQLVVGTTTQPVIAKAV